MPKLPRKCFVLTQKELHAANKLNERIFSQNRVWISSHLSDNNNYKGKVELEYNLRIIQDYLQDPDSKKDTIQCIIEKLREGDNACTPGFHGRVNSLLLLLNRPVTIDDFLQSIRTGIVDSVAHQCIGEVHHHGTFFNHAAHVLKFGVKPLNYSDIYSQQRLSNPDDILALESAIKEGYTRWSILNDLLLNIEGELRAFYDYKGRKSANEGYNYGVYNSILDFFKILLADKELSYGELFHHNDEITMVIDINWHTIQLKLWEKLRNDGYLYFKLEEERFYNKLLSQNVESFEEDLRLIDALAFYRYLYLIKYVKTSHRKILIPYIFNSIDLPCDDSFFQVLSSFKDENLKADFYQDKINAWLAIAGNEARLIKEEKLFFKFLQNFPLTFLPESTLRKILTPERSHFILLSGIRFYPQVFSNPKFFDSLLQSIIKLHGLNFTQKLLLRKNQFDYNALMLAAQYQSQAIIPLLKIVENWDEVAQKQILTSKDRFGYNPLMLATLYQPKSIVPLLEIVAPLNEAAQKQILTEKEPYGSNSLKLVIQYQPEAITLLLRITATWDKAQKQILRFVAEKQPQALDSFLKDHFSYFAMQDIYTKKLILSGSYPFSALSRETRAELTKEMNSQWNKANSEIFQIIKPCYKEVKGINDILKKSMIMDAVNSLSGENKLATFKIDLFDPKTKIYRALNFKRQILNPFCLFNSESKTLSECQKIVRKANNLVADSLELRGEYKLKSSFTRR